MPELRRYLTFGASPRASINMILAGKAMAMLRGRDYARPEDVRDLAADVLRHRLVLSYEALADNVTPDDIVALAAEMNLDLAELKEIISNLHEFNPMMGHRGCRLGITYPEITEMQARAVFEAGLNMQARGVDVRAEIMVPLVGTVVTPVPPISGTLLSLVEA